MNGKIMDGFLIKKAMSPSNTRFYQIKKKTMIFVDGFSGIADTGWAAESQKWTKFK